MSARRASLPGAAELFRATSPSADTPAAPSPPTHPGVGAIAPPPEPAPSRASRPNRRMRAVGDRSPSGRERHEEKITVYCAPEELLALETARLALRAEHGLAVDRGRIVREAIAVVLADLEAKGESSILVRRLRQP
ncbi:MAG: hypothetical protein ACRDVG_16640 [Jatrophihabitantaceae bacterium]